MSIPGRDFAAGAIVALAVVVAFWPVTSADFINWDDLEFIARSPDFNPPRLSRMIRYTAGPYEGSLYPVAYWYLGGVASIARTDHPDARGVTLDARFFHTGSLILHATAALGVMVLLRRLRFDSLSSAAGAVVFALHPVQVDAVAWVAGTNTVLSGMLAITAIAMFIHSLRDDAGNRSHWVWLVAATIAYLAALFTKPSAVVAPLIAGVIALAVTRTPPRRIIWPMIAWIIIAAPIIVITRSLQSAAGVEPTPLWFRPLVALDAITFYVAHVTAPVTLLIDYGRAPSWLLKSGAWHVTSIVGIFIIAALIALRKRLPLVFASAAIFICGLLPVLGLTPFNGQTLSTVSDRFLYLSMIGIAVLIAHALTVFRRPQTIAAVAVISILLGVRTNVRCREWQSERTLFTREIERNPTSIAGHEVLASEAVEAGDDQAAIEHYREALKVNAVDRRIPFNLANALLRSGDAHEALQYYEVAMVAQDRVSDKQPRDARIPYNAGIAHVQLNEFAQAAAAFEEALNIRPDYEPARRALQRLQVLQSHPATTTAPSGKPAAPDNRR